MSQCKGLSLMSGGLDSQLAVRILQQAGAEVEGVCFTTPFFSSKNAEKAAAALGVKLNIIDFYEEEITLVENPPHGFGGAMNPCIDCHATMIRRAGELMREKGFDFVSTGEVMGQRPMSQNRQALGVVAKMSGMEGRLVRPMCAKLLEPTIPETEGKLDREKLLDIQGRCRERQIALAKEFGIVDYPSPAGGCKLTEEGYGRKLKDLLTHEGLRTRRLVELLAVGRHFRLPDGTALVVGRDRDDNAILARETAYGTVLDSGDLPGPTALLIGGPKSDADLERARQVVAAYTKGSGVTDRGFFKDWMVC